MNKAETLNKNGDFRRIYKKGKQTVFPALVVYICKNRYGNLRYGITATKKIGGAVQRNRCRRVIREAFLDLLRETDKHIAADIVFVARGRTLYTKSTQIKPLIKKVFIQNGIL